MTMRMMKQNIRVGVRAVGGGKGGVEEVGGTRIFITLQSKRARRRERRNEEVAEHASWL